MLLGYLSCLRSLSEAPYRAASQPFQRPPAGTEALGGGTVRSSSPGCIQPSSLQNTCLTAEEEYVFCAICTIFRFFFFSFDHSLTHVQIQTTTNLPLNRLYWFFL